MTEDPNRLHTFWFKPVISLFGLFKFTMLQSSIHLVLTMSSDSSSPPDLRLPGLLHCRGGFRPGHATRAAPAPVEYLRRNAGLNQELSMLSSEHCNFMSRPAHLTVSWSRKAASGYVLAPTGCTFPALIFFQKGLDGAHGSLR